MKTSSSEIISRFGDWVVRSRAIQAALIFGSRARGLDSCARMDSYSDVDFQVVTYQPSIFAESTWVPIIDTSGILTYVYRSASGGVSKATILLKSGIEVDVVVVPAIRLHIARIAVKYGLHHRIPVIAASLDEMATVMSGGYRMLKGGRQWEKFYSAVVSEIRGARLTDCDVCKIADEFVCDFRWISKKVMRGELIAAQRVLHASLLEKNYRILHELRLRRSLTSFRDARRIEILLPPDDLEMISIGSTLRSDDLQVSARKAAQAMRVLVAEIVGDRWIWPQESYQELLGPTREAGGSIDLRTGP